LLKSYIDSFIITTLPYKIHQPGPIPQPVSHLPYNGPKATGLKKGLEKDKAFKR